MESGEKEAGDYWNPEGVQQINNYLIETKFSESNYKVIKQITNRRSAKLIIAKHSSTKSIVRIKDQRS